LKGRYNATDPELDLLLKMFPQMNHAGNSAAGMTNGYGGPDVTLDANQALLLMLTGGAPTNYTGFSTKPTQPFETTATNRKGPFITLNPKMYSVTPRSPVGVTLNTLAPGHPWLIDPHGVPYAVLAASKGRPPTAVPAPYSVNANGTSPQTLYGVTPFQSGVNYVNPSGFQIISAGNDRAFGPGGTNLPAVGVGEDDQANFSKVLLAAGIN
jgi:hypothetical protein